MSSEHYSAPSIKQIVSNYFRTQCKRNLFFDIRRNILPKPVVQAMELNFKNDKIAQKLLKSGTEWEEKKFGELSHCFNETLLGRKAVLDDRKTLDVSPSQEEKEDNDKKSYQIYEKLDEYIKNRFPRHPSGTFIFEPEITIPQNFFRRLGFDHYPDLLMKGTCRPDILELLPDALPPQYEKKFRRYVTPDGFVLPMDEEDDRQRLRVIDIKLLSQTSPSYFAEVTLYSLILACWLREHYLDSEYVVVPNAAIWPGSYRDSALYQTFHESQDKPVPMTLWTAMQDDLEEAPMEAFIGPIQKLFKETIPEVLQMTPQQCDAEVCVSQRCRACPYLEGFVKLDTPENDQWTFRGCRELVEQSGHLSLVPLMSEGTITLFRDEFGVAQTENLQQLPHEQILQSDCRYLKTSGRIAIERAKMIEQVRTEPDTTIAAKLLDDTGTSCDIPKPPDVHVYFNTSYDFVHLITLNLAMRVVDAAGQSQDHIWTIEKNDLELEANEFVRFCEDVITVLEKYAKSSIQFYFWDKTQYEHFQRLVERHQERFADDSRFSRIVFLTPPEMVLPNPAMENWQSPRTIISDVLEPRLVAPIPYHYNLLNTARCFHDPSKDGTSFKMPEIDDEIFGPISFEERLTSQIPSDVIYELWNLSAEDDDTSIEHRLELHEKIDEAVKVQLDAMETITKRLESDMEPLLFSVPPKAETIQQPKATNLAADSEIWLRFSKLDVNAAEREIKQTHSLSPLEKEMKCESAKIIGFLSKEEREEAMLQLGLISDPNSNLPLVCRLSEDSSEVKFKEDDFSCAIAPLDDPQFLSSPVKNYVSTSGLSQWIVTMGDLTSVSVMAVDREHRLIALMPKHNDPRYPQALNALRNLMRKQVIDPKNFLLEKIPADYFTGKFHRVLDAVGNPPEAVEFSISKKLGYFEPLGTTERPLTASTPASQMIWNPLELYQTSVERDLSTIFQFLNEKGISLNDSQHDAVEHALSKRLSLLWGPPGTGKSKTLRAIAVGAIHDALKTGRPLRLLITGPTNTAIDNVLHELFHDVEKYFPNDKETIAFLRFVSSVSSSKNGTKITERVASRLDPRSQELLSGKQGILVVGSTPQQVCKLLDSQRSKNAPLRCGEFFDLVLLDEASQVEVSQSFLVFSTLAKNASVVIAGDPLQMPPIQQAEVPQKLKPMLGSVYDYYANDKTWAIEPYPLLINYRSNAAIVHLARSANYPPGLESANSNLAIRLKSGSENSEVLKNEPWLGKLVDPLIPVSAFVYKDGKSNQSNSFEAFCIEKIVQYLRENLFQELGGDTTVESTDTHHTNKTFWKRGLGIVTPHRAQQALIVKQLQSVFCKSKSSGTTELKSLINNAVDTVERFQGQQRDIIIISFGMGDRDAIKNEEEFLMSLNRFNVMTSRARAKLILFLSEELVHHVPEDVEVQKQSRFLKSFTDVYCNEREPLIIETETGTENGTLLYYRDPLRERDLQQERDLQPPKEVYEKPVQPKSGMISFNRDDEADFTNFLDDAFFDASEIWISDRYLHHKRHFFSFMEFIKTLYRKKRKESIKVSVSTTMCEEDVFSEKRKKQNDFINKAEQAARKAGIDLEFFFKTEKESRQDHAREIKTNHGWTVLLDRGFDMFVFPPEEYWITNELIFDMNEETKILKTQKTYVVVEPPV